MGDGNEWKRARNLSGKGRAIEYREADDGLEWRSEGGDPFKLPWSDMKSILEDFFLVPTTSKLLGNDQQKPSAGGLGEFVSELPGRLASRNASAIAAILVAEGWLERDFTETRPGIWLRRIREYSQAPPPDATDRLDVTS